MRDLERVYKAFANRRRLAILKLLCQKRELTVSSLAKAIKLSLKATSKHLNILANADILEKEQRRLQVYYRLNSTATKAVCTLLKPISNSRE